MCWIIVRMRLGQRDGEKDSFAFAHERVEKLLSDYQQPPLDPAIDEALLAYIAKRKASEKDSFG